MLATFKIKDKLFRNALVLIDQRVTIFVTDSLTGCYCILVTPSIELLRIEVTASHVRSSW